MPNPPPISLVVAWGTSFPGFWPAFVGAVNRGARAGGATAVTSWWRSDEDNARVGGDPRSQHRWGVAVDLIGPDHGRLAEALRLEGFHVLQERTHVHAQAFPVGSLP